MCISPLYIKRDEIRWNHKGEPVLREPVPCGKCHVCQKKHLNSWLFRLTKELQVSSSAYFVTLTYNDENLKDLNKDDIRHFLKKLRRLHNGDKKSGIKYFFVGEYGTERNRPHYHAIIFNVKDPNLIQQAWGKGFTYAPPLKSPAGIKYTLKYIYKSTNITRFTMMSKNLGASFLTPHAIKYFKSRPQNCFVHINGYKMPLPKYYKEKVYNERERRAVTLYLESYAQRLENERVKKVGRVTYELEQADNEAFNFNSNPQIKNIEEIISFFSTPKKERSGALENSIS